MLKDSKCSTIEAYNELRKRLPIDFFKLDVIIARTLSRMATYSNINLVPRSVISFIQKRPLDSKTSMTTSVKFSQYYVVLAGEPASFWRENVVAVFITGRKNGFA